MTRRKGLLLLVYAVLTIILVSTGRRLSIPESPPAFFVEKGANCLVELNQGFRQPGIYQFPDGSHWLSVISLTNLDCVRQETHREPLDFAMESGRRLDMACKDPERLGISFSWMSAGKRIALGIPLHPDQMTQQDWQVLPGIGPKLAERVERDRQSNGDFGSLENLRRVKGIGPGRIAQWEKFFNNL